MNASAATISRRISRLEDQLGVRLLVRTTRRLALTDAGRNYLERCEAVLAALEEADLSVAEERDARPSGRLRVTAPGAFGRRHLAGHLVRFAAAYPAIRLDVTLTDERIDIIERGIDVAIRMSSLANSGLIARKLADNRRHLCAAPAYLAVHGMPRLPSELSALDGLFFEGYGDAAAWAFSRGGAVETGLPREMFRTNDIELVQQLALAGRGLAILPDFLAREALATGRLQPLLEDFELPGSGIYALHISRRHVPLRIRTFIDFLATVSIE